MRSKTVRLLPLLLLAIGCFSAVLQGAGPKGPVPSFRAIYQLSRNGIAVGRLELTLRRPSPSEYVYQALTLPTGLAALWREDQVLELSTGRAIDGRLRPDRYLYRRLGGPSRRSVTLDFDWDQGQVENQVGASRWSMDIPAEALDKLVLQLAFMQDLPGGHKDLRYQVADGGHLKEYRYRISGRETLATALGELDCLKSTRSKQGLSPDSTFWSAPSLRFLPVRIRREHKDGSYRMDLEHVEWTDPQTEM